MHLDLEGLIKATGYIGVGLIIFAESGLLVGIFLPGDSLLFTAGFLASQGYLNIAILIAVSVVAAITGDSTGYYLGQKFGPRIFKRKQSVFFDREHLRRAEEFYKKHGKKTIILARFTPIVRTLAPILAGVGSMHYRTFLAYNIIGGVLWGAGITVLGYFLGSVIPNVDKYLLPIIALIILLSLLPTIIHVARDAKLRHSLWLSTKKWLQRK
jgi:membrane-associated protein